MDKSENIAELAKALVSAQLELKNPGFDAKNPHFRSNYASLASVRDTVTPVLARHGLAISQIPEHSEDGRVHLLTMLLHSSGEWLSSNISIKADKENAHGYGSALTYARRYALMAIVNVVGDDDDDGNAASQSAASKPEIPNEVRAKLQKTANYIIRYIAKDDKLAVAQAWAELTKDEKTTIWIAITKGGFFTQEQKDYIREASSKGAKKNSDEPIEQEAA